MKKVILASALSIFCAASFAQVDTSRAIKPQYNNSNATDPYKHEGDEKMYPDKVYNPSPSQNPQDLDRNQGQNHNQDKTNTQSQKRDSGNGNSCSVQMINGKMMKVSKDGETTPLDRDMTLQNGTTVTKDGTLKMKNGKTKRLKEGECLSSSGKMNSSKNPGHGGNE